MSTATLAITGMSCGHCVAAVADALGALPGVTVDQVTIGAARLHYDAARTSPADAVAAVQDAGYDATLTGTSAADAADAAAPAPRPA